MMAFRYQALGNLVIGLLLALLLGAALPSQAGVTEKARPFTTHQGMLMVTTKVYRDQPPEILEVKPLASGRVTVVKAGEYSLSLLDGSGKDLYSLPFQVVFLKPGDPPEITDEVTIVLVIPAGQGAETVRLTSPQGSAELPIKK